LHCAFSFFVIWNYALIMPHINPLYACFRHWIAIRDGRARHKGKWQR
jgi:hypothetical protein